MNFSVSITLIPDDLGNTRYTLSVRGQIRAEKWQNLLTSDEDTWYIDGATAAECAVQEAQNFMAGFMRGLMGQGYEPQTILQTVRIDGQLIVSDLAHLN